MPSINHFCGISIESIFNASDICVIGKYIPLNSDEIHHTVNTAIAPPITSPRRIARSVLRPLKIRPSRKITAMNLPRSIPISSGLSSKEHTAVIPVIISDTIKLHAILDAKYPSAFVLVSVILVNTPFFCSLIDVYATKKPQKTNPSVRKTKA